MMINDKPCAIVHGDVTPGNIFFDLGYNALLGDIYHGDEPSEDVTTHTITTNADCSLGYEDRYKSAGDRILVSKDLFSLGIVTLQMLKWQPAVETVRNGDGSCADGHLFDRVRQLDASEQNVANVHHYQLIQQHDTFIDDNIWLNRNSDDGGDGNYFQAVYFLAELALKCLTNPQQRISALRYAETLKSTVFDPKNSKELMESWTEDGNTCVQCRLPLQSKENRCQSYGASPPICYLPPDTAETDYKPTSDRCSQSCRYNKFCVECIRNEFRNPLHCVQHGPVFALFGHENSMAVLLLGEGRTENERNAFIKDIRDMKRMITDPRVMGIRPGNVHELSNTTSYEQIERIFAEKENQLEFLLVYYTGHTLEDSRLEECLEKVTVRRLLCIIDCCRADEVHCLIPERKKDCESRVVLRSSERTAKASPTAGSTFTRYYLAGLRSAVKCPCSDGVDCQHLKQFRDQSSVSGFVTLANLLEYASKHMSSQKPLQDVFAYKNDHVLAFFNREPIVYSLQFVPREKQLPDVEVEEQQIDFTTSFDDVSKQLRQEILPCLLNQGAEHGPCDPTTEFALETSTGSAITDVSVLQAALKNGNVVIRIQT